MWLERGLPLSVQGIDGDSAITNEPSLSDYYTAEELKADPTLAFRRIALANLEVCK